jgi:hypothetical protein
MDQLRTRSPTPPPNCDEGWKIACHEAGHTIVAVLHEIPFDKVLRGDGEEGEVEVGVNPIDDEEIGLSNEQLKQWQEFYAAGAAAERAIFGEERRYAANRDMCHHGKLESRLPANRDLGFEDDVRTVLVQMDASVIRDVAGQLRVRRSLTFDVVAQAMGHTPSWEVTATPK